MNRSGSGWRERRRSSAWRRNVVVPFDRSEFEIRQRDAIRDWSPTRKFELA